MPLDIRFRPPARKRWGQHFLVDPNLIRKIIATVAASPEDVFLEIGPGHGELTIPLALEAGSVTAVDIDPLLTEQLRRTVPPNVTVIQEDVLKVDLPTLLPAGCRVYGSLPYNITSPILFRLVEHRGWWRDAHFIVQREVATRLAASPGGKDYGRLSVMVQAFTSVHKCFDLPAHVFRPRPRVASSLIRLQPTEQHGKVHDELLFAQLVRLAFGQRRKKLSNALQKLPLGDILRSFDLSDLRAEDVEVSKYIQLVNRLSGSYRQDEEPEQSISPSQ